MSYAEARDGLVEARARRLQWPPMSRRLAWLPPHLPAALLLLFSAASGTFFAGARGGWALAGHLALLAFVAAFGRLWPDLLGLGRRGGWLLLAFGATLVTSWLTSPVPRAGRLSLILLPAFLLVPSAVARCWATSDARRLGLRSLSVAVAVVAGVSLAAAWRYETAPSLPLGHHNLLAAWLLATLPLAAVPWRDGGAGRAPAALATALGLAALVATRSLGAAVAVAAVGAGAVLLRRAGRRVLTLALAAAALLLLPQSGRIYRIVTGADTSAAARLGYLEAGWRGWLERPMLGWGPGAARWTIGEHLRPVPGVHPPDEVVGDLHGLPLEVGYELGWSGLLLAGGLVIAFVRRRRRVEAGDPALRQAALLGLALLAAVSCFGLPLAVSALPLAAAVCVGAVLAAEPSPEGGSGRSPALLAAVLTALALPLDFAHLACDRAVDAGSRVERLRHLRRAASLDPDFPLYRARLAWLEAENRPADPEPARDALAAAEAARGSAPLWLVAGGLGQEAGEPWSRNALIRACELSPLGAMAPFRLTLDEGPAVEMERWTARALLAAPTLLAAVDWRGRLPQLRAAVGLLADRRGVDHEWRRELEGRVERLAWASAAASGPIRRLVLEMDGEAPTSASLYTFRRRPWPVYLVEVEIVEALVAESGLTAATRLATTDAAVFEAEGCGLGP